MNEFEFGKEAIIDSHCHVVKAYFGDAQEEVIARAFACRVVQLVNPSVSLADIAELLSLAERFAGLFVGMGVHPHEAKDWRENSAELLLSAARNSKVVAIGECGLDYFYKHSEPAKQEEAFAAQIRIARELNKPIIVHCRDAWNDTLSILESLGGGSLRGVFHCFTGGVEQLPRISKLGFYVSFSGIVTFPKSDKLQEAARLLPADKILVETDCPYLAPQRVRGQRNEPAYVWMVAEKLAELRNTSVDEIAALTTGNARRLFALPEPT